MAEQLAPSQIRKLILDEHNVLRQRLDELEATLAALERDGAPEQLATQLLSFISGFHHHLAQEERFLRPLLAEIDAWGKLRVQLMDEEHSLQRERVANLDRLVASEPPATWASSLKSFIEDLRKDMAAEEKDALHPNLLRDDTVTIDYFGG